MDVGGSGDAGGASDGYTDGPYTDDLIDQLLENYKFTCQPEIRIKFKRRWAAIEQHMALKAGPLASALPSIANSAPCTPLQAPGRCLVCVLQQAAPLATEVALHGARRPQQLLDLGGPHASSRTAPPRHHEVAEPLSP